MSQSVTHYVNVSVALEGTPPPQASFGTMMLVHEQDALPDRLAGPFTTTDDVVDYGFAVGSEPYLFAQSIVAQQPRVQQFYVGRQATTDATLADTMAAILEVNPGAWYAAFHEDRAAATSLALAQFIESSEFPKIALVQSNDASLLDASGPSYSAEFGGTPANGTYRLIFTGFGLPAPVNLDVVRAGGVPADNAALGAALRAELDTQAAAAGDLEDIVDPDSIGGTGAEALFAILPGLAAGTVTVTDPEAPDGLEVTLLDAGLAAAMFLGQYRRTALVYHPTDAEFLDAAWASRVLAFDLDVKKGNWAYHRPAGVTATSLTNTQTAALRANCVNYYSPATMSAGDPVEGFMAMGRFPNGTAGEGLPIDTTITLDWSKARLESGLLGVLLRAAASGGVSFDDPGINRFAASAAGVFSLGVAANHYLRFEVPEGQPNEGEMTPKLYVPKYRDVLAADRTGRLLRFQGLAYLKESIERVVYNLEVRRS